MDLFGISKVYNFVYLRFVFDSCSIVKMGMNERRKEMDNSYKNYEERKSLALTLVLISLFSGGGVAPGVATMWVGEKICEARRKRKADGERLAY